MRMSVHGKPYKSRAIGEDMRRGWDSNPRNTLISVHRISNAAHSTNSDTSPVIEYKESFSYP